jgi:hypothetical protein
LERQSCLVRSQDALVPTGKMLVHTCKYQPGSTWSVSTGKYQSVSTCIVLSISSVRTPYWKRNALNIVMLPSGPNEKMLSASRSRFLHTSLSSPCQMTLIPKRIRAPTDSNTERLGFVVGANVFTYRTALGIGHMASTRCSYYCMYLKKDPRTILPSD